MFSTSVKLATFVVKFSTVFIVLVVVNSDQAAPVSVKDAAIARILKSRSISETENYHLLTPELADVALDLYIGLNLGTFKIGGSTYLQHFMSAVNVEIKAIAKDVASIAVQIESVAEVVDAFHIHPRLDYIVKGDIIKKLCEETLERTKDALRLIDATKVMLGKGVDQNIMRVVELQVTSINDILKLATFEIIRKTMKDELDTERTDIAMIEGRIKAAKETIDVISSTLENSEDISEQDLVKEAEAMVMVVDQLKTEVHLMTRKLYLLVLLRIIEEKESQN